MGNPVANTTNQLKQPVQVTYGPNTRNQPRKKIPGGVPQMQQQPLMSTGLGMPGVFNPQGMPQGMPQGESYGGKINQDGSFNTITGGHDWLVGYGPKMNWGGQDVATGKGPISPNPGTGDDLGIPRGTPQYRQQNALHDKWMRDNLAAGLSLADLGAKPVRGGGLAAYMKYGGRPLGSTGL